MSINKIILMGMEILFGFVILFSSLVVYEEYQDFNNHIKHFKSDTNSSIAVHTQIEVKREELKSNLIQYMIEVLTLSSILFGIALGGIKIINHFIHKELDNFSNFLSLASKEYINIDTNQIQLQEFKILARFVNDMVDELHEKQEQLIHLNKTLEDRVIKKTRKLSLQNKELEKEKHTKELLLKMQDRFIKQSIHEINTPLAVIMTHIDLYVMKHGENRYLSKIESATKILNTIYADLTYLMQKDRFEYPKENVDFSYFMQERVGFFEDIAKSNYLSFDTHIEDNIFLYFSQIELQRVVDNNLSNAIKYALVGTIVTIKLTKKAMGVELSFETISKKIKEPQKVFESFYQEDECCSGFGLGLDIVMSICSKNQVDISLDSTQKSTIFSYMFKKEE